MDSSSPFRAANSVAGVKRPAPTLLPAFEPASSPPRFPTSKRQARHSPYEDENPGFRYPSPLPSSSLGLSSSPPQASPYRRPPRPQLQRSLSTVSERAPLCSLPEISLPENGESVLLGRSSSSSHYRLSFNRLISRTHVRVAYIPSGRRPKIEIHCMGANGATVHCGSQALELAQNDTFTSDAVGQEIMLDVMDSRVMLKWPRGAREVSTATTSTFILPENPDNWENDENVDPITPSRRRGRDALIKLDLARELSRSPPPSPTPRRGRDIPAILFPESKSPETSVAVKVFEDEEADELPELSTQSKEIFSLDADSSSELSELESDDEENEIGKGINMSFGPGSNLPPMAIFPTRTIKTPTRRRRQPLKSTSPSGQAQNMLSPGKTLAITNHLANQLAFARVASTPLSALFTNLPASILGNDTITYEKLVDLLGSIQCVGVINRLGKDAAGKPLESEYYYIPEKDYDEERKATVLEGLRKPGLRACRKTHKQYFWRKPKMPY